MATKEIKGRIILKHDTAANWKTAGEKGFCPLANEIIMFDPDDSCAMIRYKIGRWANEDKTVLVNINDLPFESNVYVGRDEPVNAPAGFIWVDTSEDVKLISFTFLYNQGGTYGSVRELNYIAEEGMTFREWVDSQYNTDDWRCSTEYEEFIEGDHTYGITSDKFDIYIMSDGTSAEYNYGIEDCDNVIIDGKTYLFEGRP